MQQAYKIVLKGIVHNKKVIVMYLSFPTKEHTSVFLQNIPTLLQNFYMLLTSKFSYFWNYVLSRRLEKVTFVLYKIYIYFYCL